MVGSGWQVDELGAQRRGLGDHVVERDEDGEQDVEDEVGDEGDARQRLELELHELLRGRMGEQALVAGLRTWMKCNSVYVFYFKQGYRWYSKYLYFMNRKRNKVVFLHIVLPFNEQFTKLVMLYRRQAFFYRLREKIVF